MSFIAPSHYVCRIARLVTHGPWFHTLLNLTINLAFSHFSGSLIITVNHTLFLVISSFQSQWQLQAQPRLVCLLDCTNFSISWDMFSQLNSFLCPSKPRNIREPSITVQQGKHWQVLCIVCALVEVKGGFRQRWEQICCLTHYQEKEKTGRLVFHVRNCLSRWGICGCHVTVSWWGCANTEDILPLLATT